MLACSPGGARSGGWSRVVAEEEDKSPTEPPEGEDVADAESDGMAPRSALFLPLRLELCTRHMMPMRTHRTHGKLREQYTCTHGGHIQTGSLQHIGK